MHRFNVFEGCRRITNLFLAIWAIGCILVSYSTDTTLYLQFNKYHPDYEFSIHYVKDATFLPLRKEMFDDYAVECDVSTNDLSAHRYISSINGHLISATLCFVAMEFGEEDKTMLIPHLIKDGMVYGNTKYSDDVQKYVKSQESNFSIPNDEEKRIDEIYLNKRIEHYKTALKFLLGGLFVIWLLSTVIGWIARGFMGVPLGEDHRPQHD